jgi:hypothetical protein
MPTGKGQVKLVCRGHLFLYQTALLPLVDAMLTRTRAMCSAEAEEAREEMQRRSRGRLPQEAQYRPAPMRSV